MSSIIGDVFGIGGIGEASKALLDDVGKLIPDTNLKTQVQAAAQSRSQELVEKTLDYANQQKLADVDLLKQQIELNKLESQSDSWLSRNWRPVLAFSMVVSLNAGIWVCLYCFATRSTLDFNGLVPIFNVILGVLLPLAGIRTLDKSLGVTHSPKTAPQLATFEQLEKKAPGPDRLAPGLSPTSPILEQDVSRSLQQRVSTRVQTVPTGTR